MRHFRAVLSNGIILFFSAKDADAGLNYGNKQAKQKKVQMVAIGFISDKDAKAQGLIN